MDNNNAWNYRPNTNGVDVKLLANGVEYKTIHLTQTNAVKDNTNSWTYSFTGLPTYLNGHAVVWTAGKSQMLISTPLTHPTTVITALSP